MKIKTGKQAAFEVDFYAESFLGRGHWRFLLPTIEVARITDEIGIHFGAFFWAAGVTVKKAKE